MTQSNARPTPKRAARFSHVADQLLFDRRGRPLPNWTGCRTLAEDEVFLLMEGVPDSFDGRYFGPVPMTAIIGKLASLWVR